MTASMKPISKAAQKIFDKLTAKLGVGEARKFDNAPGVYMALHVERLTKQTFSLAHYYEQMGDLMQDPDMVFWRAATGAVFPVSITQAPMGVYREALILDAREQPSQLNPRAMAELASFAGMWLKNIKGQQF